MKGLSKKLIYVSADIHTNLCKCLLQKMNTMIKDKKINEHLNLYESWSVSNKWFNGKPIN